MSLTLDEVRNIKFRMAKRSGYEVLDVDEFVDQVEASFEQLLEENANLKRQVESLKATSATAAAPADQAASNQQSEAQPTATAETPSGERLVVTTSGEASAAVVRLVQMATEQAESLVAEADAEAQKVKSDAERSAKQTTTDASTRAERVESEARVNAERIRSDAQTRADRLNRDTEDKRRELFGELEKQRDQLAASVAELRKFESDFRQNLTNELRTHIDSLQAGKAEPAGAPKVLAEGRSDQGDQAAPKTDNQQPSDGAPRSQGSPSGTPRLDALLGNSSE
jgi:DivIVA domain-containing protein